MKEDTQTNMNHDDILDVITDFPVKPLWGQVIITVNTDEADGVLVLSDSSFSEKQYVVSGSIEYGDTKVVPGTPVLIDIKKLMKTVKTEVDNVYGEYKVVEIDPLKVNGIMYAVVDSRVIKAIDLR
jgi:hypothetical protein